VYQHGADSSGGSNKIETACEKRRKADKRSVRIGKTTESGTVREKLPGVGDVKNDTAGL
jgi:hypothetical protein